MPQPTISAASWEYSSTSAKRPLADGPSRRARAMSVAKMRTARPNLVRDGHQRVAQQRRGRRPFHGRGRHRFGGIAVIEPPGSVRT